MLLTDPGLLMIDSWFEETQLFIEHQKGHIMDTYLPGILWKNEDALT